MERVGVCLGGGVADFAGEGEGLGASHESSWPVAVGLVVGGVDDCSVGGDDRDEGSLSESEGGDGLVDGFAGSS